MDDDAHLLYLEVSYLLNGPIMLGTCVIGFMTNIFSFYVLFKARIPIKRDSSLKLAYTPSDPMMPNVVIEGHRTIWEYRIGSNIKRSQRRPRIYVYLLWLTGCDIALLVFAFLNFSLPRLIDVLQGFYAKLIPFGYMLCNATFILSVWLMLTFVRDRYRALCSRLSRSIKSRHDDFMKIHKKLGIFTITSLLFSIPRFFELDVVYQQTQNVYSMNLTSLIDNKYYMLGYRIFGSLCLYSAIPYIFIFIMSSRIVLTLRTASKIRSKMYVTTVNNMLKSDSDWLIMILAVRFLISRLPTTMLDVVESILGSKIFLSSHFTMIALLLSNFFVVLSSATTFFILFFVSKKFRCSVYAVFRRTGIYYA